MRVLEERREELADKRNEDSSTMLCCQSEPCASDQQMGAKKAVRVAWLYVIRNCILGNGDAITISSRH